MKTNFYDYAYNALHQSIILLDNKDEVVSYYGDKNECTIEDYFAPQSDGNNLYDSTDEFSDDTLIGSIDELRSDFESARENAFAKFIENN